MGELISELRIEERHWQAMLADVESRKHEEACGLVAGVDQTSCVVFPVANALHSPVRYQMDPKQQLQVLLKIEEEDWQLLAIYHSHLGGPLSPSSIDVAEANYPGVVHLIWSRTTGEWSCLGFLIEGGSVQPVPLSRLEAR